VDMDLDWWIWKWKCGYGCVDVDMEVLRVVLSLNGYKKNARVLPRAVFRKQAVRPIWANRFVTGGVYAGFAFSI